MKLVKIVLSAVALTLSIAVPVAVSDATSTPGGPLAGPSRCC